MNQYSKEITEEMTKMAKKYGIKNAMLIFEEEVKEDKSKTNYRFMVFGDEEEKKGYSECAFATLLGGVVKVSKTFRDIAEHANRHTIGDALIDCILPLIAKKAD